MAFHRDPTEQVFIARYLFKRIAARPPLSASCGGKRLGHFPHQPGICHQHAARTSLAALFASSSAASRSACCITGPERIARWATTSSLKRSTIHGLACPDAWPRSSCCRRWRRISSAARPAAKEPRCRWGAAWLGGLPAASGSIRFHTRSLPAAGISAGFGSIFGTPLAGMVFGLEVLAVGRLRYDALIPCLVASVVGDWTCTAWNVEHTNYRVLITSHVEMGPLLVGKVILASLAFALISVLFAETTHLLQSAWPAAWIAPAPRSARLPGGIVVIALVWLVDSRDYLGLGVPFIVQSFTLEGVATWAFFWKLVFTAVTLGSGFKGGEVTPPSFSSKSGPRLDAGDRFGCAARFHGRSRLRGRVRRGSQHAARLHHHGHGTVRHAARHFSGHRLLLGLHLVGPSRRCRPSRFRRHHPRPTTTPPTRKPASARHASASRS